MSSSAWTRRRPEVLGLLLCLVVVAALVTIRPEPTDFLRRFSDVGIGETGRLRVFDVTVTRVQRVTVVPRTEGPFTSDQAVVVVDLEAAVRTAPTYFTQITLRTRDGHIYDPRPEFSGAVLGLTQPGFTTSGTLVFELPPRRLTGARLQVDPDGGEFDAYDAAVRVDLGLRTTSPVTTLSGPLADSTTRVTG